MAGETKKVCTLVPSDGGISLDFGIALEALKNGQKVWREGWHEKDLRIVMISISGLVMADKDSSSLEVPVVVNGSESLIEYWHPGVSDVFAQDWHFEQ